MAINVKRLLANALIELTEEKPLAKITITDIVTRAGAGRQTFYNHFHDKNDLIYWIFLRTLAGEQHLVATAGYFAYLSKLYREAQKYSRFLQQACKITGQNSLPDAIFQQTYHYYRNYIMTNYGAEVFDAELEYALTFNAYGATQLYILWAEKGMPGSAEEQARFAIDCMPACIKKYFLPDTPSGGGGKALFLPLKHHADQAVDIAVCVNRHAPFAFKLAMLPAHPAHGTITIDVGIFISEAEVDLRPRFGGQIFHLSALKCPQVDPLDPMLFPHGMTAAINADACAAALETTENNIVQAVCTQDLLLLAHLQRMQRLPAA